MKLHGSIDWCFETTRGSVGRLPQQAVKVTTNPLEDRRPPAVIFGQREKLRPDGPFLELLALFAAELEATSQLCVVGYSFRDGHINEIIRRWINADDARILIVVDPWFPYPGGMYQEGFKYELLHHLAPPRLPQGATAVDPSESRLHVIRKTAKDGLPEALAARS